MRVDIKAFANTLAADISRRYPPELDKQEGKRVSANRMSRIVEDACQKAIAFRDEHNLGWLGKSRLSNSFRWALIELGYEKDFVDLATEALVVYLSRKSPAP